MRVREVVMNEAGYARALYISDHRDVSERTVRLWFSLFPQGHIPDLKKAVNDSFLTSDDVLDKSDIICDAWSVLLPNGLSDYQDIEIFKAILSKLDENCSNGQDENAEDYGRWIVLLGLAKYLIRYCQRSADWNLCFLQGLSYELLENKAFKFFVWAFLSMLAVEWFYDEAPHPRKALAEAVRMVLPVLDKCLDKNEKTLLAVTGLYAQKIAREMRSQTVISYYLHLSSLFRSTVVRENLQKELLNPQNQVDCLTMLLYIAVMEERLNEAKGA